MVGKRIGKYRLVRQIGEGGMGVVYEAVREDISARAALKVLRPEYAVNPEIAGRFFNEARAANLIAHPGIVRVFDYGHQNGSAYLAMEYLEGESLWKRIERRRRLTLIGALRIGRQVATALAAAHDKQIVHRDLKPDNIFIIADPEAPGGERAKLLDFGIAKMADEYRGAVRTQLNVIMGTPAYMAPEQCRGSRKVAGKTDVYALGCILFEMLSGRTPFITTEPGEFLALHMLTPPPRLSQYVPELPAAMVDLVAAMLAKEPEARPTMLEVAAGLQALSQGNGDSVPPPDPSVSHLASALAAVLTIDALGPTDPQGGRAVKFADSRPVGAGGALAFGEAGADAASGGAYQPILSSPQSSALAAAFFHGGPGLRTPRGRPISDPMRGLLRRSPAPIPGAAPALSGSVWEPMEIIKTDYHSAPEIDIGAIDRQRGRPSAYPPGMWVMIAYAALAVVATILRHLFLR